MREMLPISRISIGIVIYCTFSITAYAKAVDEEKALSLLSQAINKAHLFDIDCTSITTDEALEEYFTFHTREIHSMRCGGDPSTYPTNGWFRVMRKSGQVLKMNNNGNFLPIKGSK